MAAAAVLCGRCAPATDYLIRRRTVDGDRYALGVVGGEGAGRPGLEERLEAVTVTSGSLAEELDRIPLPTAENLVRG